MRLKGPRPLTAAQQYVCLQGNPNCLGAGRLSPGHLLWRYQTSPTPVSRLYTVRLEYRQTTKPDAYIEQPDLVDMAGGRRLPHVHQQQPTRLCLYLPGTGEWAPWMRIDRTTIPWVVLWLFFFEEWLISDDWKGGGVHPGE